MKRREFMTLVGGAAAAWPLAALGQPIKKLPKVGVLWHAASAEEEAIGLGALTRGFSDLGYIDGKTIALHHRFPAELTERFASLSAELAAIPVDVLVAVTQPAALAAQRATATIPIVFILVPEPVGSKLVNSLARPGWNITGLTNIAAELTAKRVQLLKEAFPRMTRLTLLVNPNDQQAMHRFIDEAKTAATALGLDVQPLEVRSLGEFEQAFDNMVDGRSEGVITTPNGLFYLGRVLAAQLAVKRRLPLMVQNRETLEGGALMAYGPDIQVLFRRAAVYVDKILKGEKPADLPVEVPTKFQFLINLKTAKALELTLPESLLLRADEAIE
jgi:putative ABC transport system substrate-binding protein